jgi:hypothetical protein
VRVDLQAELLVLPQRLLHIAREVGTPSVIVCELDDPDLVHVRAAVVDRGVLLCAVVFNAGIAAVQLRLNLLDNAYGGKGNVKARLSERMWCERNDLAAGDFRTRSAIRENMTHLQYSPTCTRSGY